MTVRRLAAWLPAIVGCTVVACFLWLLPDLFYMIPWWVRKAIGATLFAGLVGACALRLWMVRPGDDPPPVRGVSPRGRAERWAPWALAALVASLAWPLLSGPGRVAYGDWDYYAAKYEAARRSIVDYRQFPWWDPWTRGGFPLAGNPLCGVAGVAMPLVLAFGTTVGLELATVAGFLLAAEGARRLAALWLGDPIAAAAAGLIYSINSAVIVSTVTAYDIPMGYAVLPWMLYYIFQLDRRPSAGIGLGFWGAFNVLNGIAYFTVYSVLIAGVVWLRVARVRQGAARQRVLAGTLLALGVALLLAGWRLAVTGLVARDFPRVYQSGITLNPEYLIFYMNARFNAETLATLKASYPWETRWYIGPVVLVLLLASVLRGWRWWHTLAFVCAWLALGAFDWYEASYWLSHLPVFASMHVATRWRYMAALGVALAAADTIQSWRASGRRGLVVLAHASLALIAIDYVVYGFHALPVAFSTRVTDDIFPGPPLRLGEFKQVRAALGFAATARGYGVVEGYEPLLGYNRTAKTARLWRENPDYKGEFWTARGPLAPVFWSPNHIVLEARPGETVYVNQNPGSWWLVGGRRPPEFADWRCVETRNVFAVRADNSGRVVLTIRPRGLGLGLGLHVLGAALVALGGAWWMMGLAKHGDRVP
jgi:hypothetical protein